MVCSVCQVASLPPKKVLIASAINLSELLIVVVLKMTHEKYRPPILTVSAVRKEMVCSSIAFTLL